MKVIILVQSIDKSDYIRIREAQQQTWDSIDHHSVKTIYYKPDGQHEELVDNILNTPESLEFRDMYMSFAKALRLLLKHEWDYIFKTDNSTYVNKDLLYKLLLTKPRTDYFGGMFFPYTLEGYDKHVWGDGYVISRDIAKYIVDSFNKSPFLYAGSDDGVISLVLKDKVVFDSTLSIYELYTHNNKIEPDHHVYRVRTQHQQYSPALVSPDNLSSIIDEDIKSMYNIHNIITNGKTNHNNLN